MRHLKLNINLEDVKSRISGLFPCYNYENGAFILHNAIDFENGCYDRIVENIILPINTNLIYNDKTILQEGNTYSYKTLLKYYNIYKDKKNDTFIDFFNRGIGLVDIDRMEVSNFTNVLDEKEKILDETITDLIPESIYLSQVKNIHDKYIRQQKLCDQDIDCDIYERMGGDCMVAYIEHLITIAEDNAKEMYDCADSNTASVQGNLQLYTTIDDIGIYETILEEWQPDVEYHKGNIVTYEYETWICIVENSKSDFFNEDENNPHFEKYVINKEKDIKYDLSEGDTLVGYTDSKLKYLRSYRDYTNEIYEVERPSKNEDWLFYYRIGNVSNLEVTTDGLGNIMRYIEREPFKYILKKGKIPPKIVHTISNTLHIPLSSKLPFADETSYEKVLSLEDQTSLEKSETKNWALYEKDSTYILNLMAYGDIIDDISYNVDDSTITIKYTTGAHLKAKLRAIKRNFDNKEIFYYYPFEHDESDSIGITYEETYPYEKGGEIDNIIENGDFEEFFKNDRDILIKYIYDNKTEYLIDGVNLQKVKFNDLPSKELTKYILLDKNFYMWNGVSYVKINIIQNNYKYNKFRFDVTENLKNKDIEINNRNINIEYVESKYETKLDEYPDTFFSPITKIDYLVGNTFNPIIEHNVNINRGNAAAWERHIKLGEVKTLQDLEQYGNDYFNIQKQ